MIVHFTPKKKTTEIYQKDNLEFCYYNHSLLFGKWLSNILRRLNVYKILPTQLKDSKTHLYRYCLCISQNGIETIYIINITSLFHEFGEHILQTSSQQLYYNFWGNFINWNPWRNSIHIFISYWKCLANKFYFHSRAKIVTKLLFSIST